MVYFVCYYVYTASTHVTVVDFEHIDSIVTDKKNVCALANMISLWGSAYLQDGVTFMKIKVYAMKRCFCTSYSTIILSFLFKYGKRRLKVIYQSCKFS